jgi:hypothetical protein
MTKSPVDRGLGEGRHANEEDITIRCFRRNIMGIPYSDVRPGLEIHNLSWE